jgi:hypothetical protein
MVYCIKIVVVVRRVLFVSKFACLIKVYDTKVCYDSKFFVFVFLDDVVLC